jgi:hypothetical protein
MSGMLWAKDYLLVIDFTDGTDISFALAKKPVLTFADQRLCISVEDQNSEFELSDVLNFHFKEDPSAIRSPRVDEDFIISWRGEDLIVISNATPGIRIRLYGIDGTMYPSCVHAVGNHIEISLAALPKGIYLLNINNQRTLKINRK